MPNTKILGKVSKWCPKAFLTQGEIGNITHNAFINSKTYIYMYVKEYWFLDILNNGHFWCYRCILCTILSVWVCYEPNWSKGTAKTQSFQDSKSYKWSFTMFGMEFYAKSVYTIKREHYKVYGKAINKKMVYKFQSDSRDPHGSMEHTKSKRKWSRHEIWSKLEKRRLPCQKSSKSWDAVIQIGFWQGNSF